jgi:AraC-like DNA-binding protein
MRKGQRRRKLFNAVLRNTDDCVIKPGVRRRLGGRIQTAKDFQNRAAVGHSHHSGGNRPPQAEC